MTLACRPDFQNYEDLLSAWYLERKQQLETSLAITVSNGSAITESNRFKILLRDWYLWGIQLVPSWKRQVEMGHRYYGMIKYKYEPGMAFLPNCGGGFCFPQVYCVKLERNGENSTVTFTDDAIFDPAKTGLFRTVVLLDNLAELDAAQKALTDIDALSNNELHASSATYILQSTIFNTADLHSLDPTINIYRLATGSEFTQSPLCEGRPVPKYYDEHRLSKEAGGKRFVVLRPDYFAFAACMGKEEVDIAATGIARLAVGLPLEEAVGEVEGVRPRL